MEAKALSKLQAPAPSPLQPLDSGSTTQAVKFARVVVDLKPEPWAFVYLAARSSPSGQTIMPDEKLVSWQDGAMEVKPSAVSGIFDDEMKKAGVPVEGETDSLFSQDAAANIQIAVKVTEMNGRFCLSCGWRNGDTWSGAVVMNTHWEIYSSLERRVVAVVDTTGGFSVEPAHGLGGEADRLVYEAFRDNVRGLIASENFRRIVTTAPGSAADHPASKDNTAIQLLGAKTSPQTAKDASKSVVVIYAGNGSGSGFLVSSEGYLITNHHVVGGVKYVKVKWADGSEDLGEVIRSDRRRDVALVKVNAHGRAPLALRTSATEPGEAVFAIGTPLDKDFQNTLTKGIVSANRVFDGQTFIQSDAAVDHGNSGGPLLDEKGAVVGITQWFYSPDGAPHNLNFFIPIGDALKVLALQPAN